MITIRSEFFQQFRTVARKGLGITKRKRGPNVWIAAGDQGLCIRANTDDVALEFSRVGEFSPANFTAPFDVLRDCTAVKNSEVTFRIGASDVAMNWAERGIPKSLRFPKLDNEDFPAIPDRWSTNRPELMTALRNACETADSESSRYALSDLRLRGSDGQVAATDGRQLYAHAGFDFPWEEALLIPASRLFTCADLQNGSVVRVGKLDDKVVIRCEPWTIWLKIDQGSRFPEIDSLLRANESSATILNLADTDAKFLQQSLKHLPGSGDFNSPATVDLNGSVAVRCRGEGESKPTELILVQSKREGEEVRFAANRQYLARAAQLGFRRFQIGKPESPVVSRDGDRTYVWANLSKASALPHESDAVQIKSPAGRSNSAGRSSSSRIERTTTRRVNGNQSVSSATAVPTGEALEHLDKIVASLRESLSDFSAQVQDLEHLVHDAKPASKPRFTEQQLQAMDA